MSLSLANFFISSTVTGNDGTFLYSVSSSKITLCRLPFPFNFKQAFTALMKHFVSSVTTSPTLVEGHNVSLVQMGRLSSTDNAQPNLFLSKLTHVINCTLLKHKRDNPEVECVLVSNFST